MIGLSRLPVRLRLTVTFAVVMAVLFGVIEIALYWSMSTALLDEIDTGLRSRASTIEAAVRARGITASNPDPRLLESRETFAEIVDANGRVLQTSLRESTSPLSPSILTALERPRFFERRLPDVAGVARVLAVPIESGSSRIAIVVGTTMQDRRDALHLLTILLVAGGPAALALASVAGWLLAGSALRPVDRMRRQASAISSSGLDRRLSVPEPEDEIKRLATTLNAMLDRLDESMRIERQFLDNASHELRTPLAILRTELDLAASRARTPEELNAAIRSTSEEVDRLTRLAEDLLVLSRARAGRLPVHRTPASVAEIVEAARLRFAVRADEHGVRIETNAMPEIVSVDAMRVRQVVDNLLDNALTHARAGGTVSVRAALEDRFVSLHVDDDGPGFPEGFDHRDPNVPSSDGIANGARRGTGLGLSIVRAIAESHGGTLTTANRPEGGAHVTVTLLARPTEPD